jgi:Ca2+-transporting ATPase
MEQGLSTHHAKQKQTQFGKNVITQQKKFSAVVLLLSQFPTLLNAILFLGALFSFFIGDFVDASFILSILLINGVIGFFQEYRAEKSLEKLKAFVTPLSRVIRDGKETEIPTQDIVADDIVILGEGDRVPADGVLVQNHHIEIDEAMLTGESFPVVKNHEDTVFCGTLVIKGSGKCKITQIGMTTRLGKIAQTLTTVKTDKTPLQVKLDSLGKIISGIAIILALLIIPASLFYKANLLQSILVAISVAIAAIPEGLPAVVTIALALGTNRMAKKNAIVRKMPVIETLGAVQVVLMDKTGTLTKNQMRVKTQWVASEHALSAIIKASLLGNTASLVQKANGNGFDVLGDQTDGALLLWAKDQGFDQDIVKKEGTIIEEYTFDPQTRTITTVWEHEEIHPEGSHPERKKYVFVRGAPETLLEHAKNTCLSEAPRKHCWSMQK